jgi:hypothetical protein
VNYVSFFTRSLADEAIVVNIVHDCGLPRWQDLCFANDQAVNNFMWLPTAVYEKVPQFWLLIGLLFIAAGLYIGFEYVLTTYYVGLGIVCCGYGIGIYVLRLRNRQSKYPNDEPKDDESIGIRS